MSQAAQQLPSPVPFLNNVVRLFSESQVNIVHVHLVAKVLKTLQRYLKPCDVQPFLAAVQPLLTREDESVRPFHVAAKEIIHALTRSVGLDHIVAVIAVQANDNSEAVRDAAARTFAVAVTAVGVDEAMVVIEGFLRAKVSMRARCTVLKMVEQVAITTGCGIRPHVATLVGLIVAVNTTQETAAPAFAALGALAEAAAPYGLEAFKSCWSNRQELVDMTYSRSGEQVRLFLQMHCSILLLVSIGSKRLYAYNIVRNFVAALISNCDLTVGLGLKGLKLVFPHLKVLLETDPPCPDWFGQNIPAIVHRTWGFQSRIVRENYELLVEATLGLVDLVGIGYVYQMLEYKKSREYRRRACEVIEKIVNSSCQSRGDAEFRDTLEDIHYLFMSPNSNLV